MQGFMALYLRESVEVFLSQQKLMREQMASLIQTAPVSVFAEVAKQNLRLWQSMQESFLKSMSPETPPSDQRGKPKNG
jgi:polyhydroxyalkanoate synthesis regulator protein